MLHPVRCGAHHGGTRIGAALGQFLADGRCLARARGALIVVMSDGLERGDPADMAAAVERLGELSITRTVKDDGRALILYSYDEREST